MRKSLTSFFARRTAWSYAGIIVLFIGVEALFSFCSKKKSCPAFQDPDFDYWFPYRQGEVVYFQSTGNDKDTLRIETVHRSEAYETGGGWYGGSCNSGASIYSQHTVGQPPALQVQWSLFEGNPVSRTEVVLREFRLYGATLERQGITIENAPYNGIYTGTYLPTTTLDGRTFSRVLEIQRDTTASKEMGIYKIWLASGQGVVAYQHYPTNERWVKQ